MESSSLTYFAQLIGYQVPTILAGLLGVILSFVLPLPTWSDLVKTGKSIQ